MHEEPADELSARQKQFFLPAAVLIVLPPDRNPVFVHFKYPGVGYGGTVSITGQIGDGIAVAVKGF